MDIGVVRERGGRGHDRRVVLMPAEVAGLVARGHRLFVESGSGKGIGVGNAAYAAAGAGIVPTPADAMSRSLVLKIKAPTPAEAVWIRPGGMVLTMLHAEQSPESAWAIARAGGIAVAMEAIVSDAGERWIDGTDITGEQAMLMAFHRFEKRPAECKVLVMGYGRVATAAVATATRLGAHVQILRKCMFAHIEHHLSGVDLLVNGLAWPQDRRERQEYIVPRSLLPVMNRPAMVVDLAVDAPGPIESCRPTDMKSPVYTVDGVRHLCIYGYPALAPYSCSALYSRQLLPIVLELAEKGILPTLPEPIRRAVVDWRGRSGGRSGGAR